MAAGIAAPQADLIQSAQILLGRARALFDVAVDCVAGLCAVDGKLDQKRLDRHQGVCYEVALASADLLAADTVVAASIEAAPLDAGLALSFAADTFGSVLARLESVFLDTGVELDELHALANSCELAQLRIAAASSTVLAELGVAVAVSLYWCGLNKGKRSVSIDLASAEGQELATALICAPGADAGMLLTNFPPRGFLSYEALRQQRPDLIQLTIQGDRHGGSAIDNTVNARVGIPFLTGEGDANEIVNHLLPAWDLVTGQMAAVGLLAAERHRRLKHVGQHVHLALEDMALAVMGHLGFIAEAQLGVTRERVGNDMFGAFGRDFATADGEHVMVVGLTPKQWRGLCAATGLGAQIAELAASLGLDLDAEGNRFQARGPIGALVGAWIKARRLADVAAAFDAHGVCWGKYQTVAELVRSDSACSEANPMFSTVEQPGVGPYLVPGLPLSFSAIPRVPPRPAPRLGEHTEEVLTGVLGLGSAEMGRLFDRRVIGRPHGEGGGTD